MRCFTFSHGELKEGIQTTLSNSERRLVYLGLKGPYCRYHTVFFTNKKDEEPVVDKDGLIHLAYPTKWKYNYKVKGGQTIKQEKVVLLRAFPSPTKVLLRINTSTQSTRRINGRWQARGGWPIPWVKAHGFSKGQKWCDDLVAIDDQDVIMIVPAGGGRDDRMIVRNDCGEISCLPELEYLEILRAHEKELKDGKAAKKLADEAIKATPEKEVVEVVEASVDPILEVNKEETPENHENGKASRVQEVVVHEQESGETIGA